MRGSQFEGLNRTEALLNYKAYNTHREKVKQAKPQLVAGNAIAEVDDLINGFQ